MSLINDGLQACLETRIWPDYRQPLASLRDEAFLLLLSPPASALVLSFKYGWRLYFDVHPVQYPQPFHPVRIIHKWRMAMLTIFLSSFLAAPSETNRGPVQSLIATGVDFGVVLVGLLMEFQENVKRSHGVESEFARHSAMKIAEIKADMTRDGMDILRAVPGKLEGQWRILREIAASKELKEDLPLASTS